MRLAMMIVHHMCARLQQPAANTHWLATLMQKADVGAFQNVLKTELGVPEETSSAPKDTEVKARVLITPWEAAKQPYNLSQLSPEVGRLGVC